MPTPSGKPDRRRPVSAGAETAASALDPVTALPDILDAYPGPIALLSEDGLLLSGNPAGLALLRGLEAQEGRLARFCGVLHAQDANHLEIVELAGGGGQPRQTWIEVMGLAAPQNRVLLIGRDVTLEISLRAALADSRQRYKDLVEISADIAWEIDGDGRFAFVSPGGIAGCSVHQLIGLRPAAVWPDSVADLDAIFAARAQVVRKDLWVNDPGGDPVCLMVSVVPMLDKAGGWHGARGIAWDVTVERLREQSLARARLREHVGGYLINVIRNEARPQEMLEAAVASLSRAFKADACAIYRVRTTGAVVPAAHYGDTPPTELTDQLTKRFSGGERAVVETVDGWHVLALATAYGGQMNGAVSLWRADADAVWNDDDRSLLESIEPHIGIALRQIQDQRKLEQLSRTDALTGLSNRRAFLGDLDSALGVSARTGRSGALLYIDLDNFKPVNDLRGHDAGDEAIRQVAHLLKAATRPYDLVARLGGDEFALWLSEIDEATARQRVAELVERFATLRPLSASPDRPFGASVGLAFHDGTSVKGAEALMAEADAAMYEVKRASKMAAAADAPTQPPPVP